MTAMTGAGALGRAAPDVFAAVRVVIVDDTEDLRELLRYALVRAGMEVVADAGDGEAGIEAVREHRPDVVLLDLSMPVMDGMTALPRIRELVPDARIIVFSGFGASQLTDRALANGADDYLQKGTSLSKILDRVREVLERPRRDQTAPVTPIGATGTGALAEPSDALTLAPYGVLQVGAERPHPVLWANPVAHSLLHHRAEPGTPLAQVTTELAGVVATHRLRREGTFDVEIGGHACQVAVRHAGASLYLYIESCIDEVGVLRTAIAATAHEVRGPVTVLAGLAETIRDAAEDGFLDGDHLSQMTAAIARQARILDSITADLLTTAQVQRGTLRMSLEAVDPRAVIDAAIADRGVDLATMEIEDPRYLRADPLRLEQMVTNLLGNAHKHGRAPVFVRVRASRDDPAMVSIDVEDSGDGVAPEFRDQLFREFSRGETAVPGTGLGLHVVRTLALAHGGAVSYAPAPGGGAMFTITLPAV